MDFVVRQEGARPTPSHPAPGGSLRRSAARRAARARRRRALRASLALAALGVALLAATPGPGEAPRAAPSRSPAAAACPVPTGLRDDFAAASRATTLPVGLLAAVARVESGFRADARSRAGAVGILQLMPATAAALDYDPRDSASNLIAGALYLTQLLARYGGNLDLALAAYNAGPTAVDRAGGAPTAETAAYVREVERAARAYGACA